MSQIGSAYILSNNLLRPLDALAASANRDAIWSFLQIEATEVLLEFVYSGSILSVAMAYLEEHGIALLSNLPPDLTQDGVVSLGDYESLAACISSKEAPGLLAPLRLLNPHDDDLRLYYEEFTEEGWSESGAALQEALAF